MEREVEKTGMEGVSRQFGGGSDVENNRKCLMAPGSREMSPRYLGEKLKPVER